METLLALLAFVASLLGFHGGRDVVVHHVGGTHALSSRATVEAGVAHFECFASASGACHYVVLPRDCASHMPCSGRSYEVAAGDSRQVTGLHSFRLCVGVVARAPAQCSVVGAAARWSVAYEKAPHRGALP